MLNNSNEEIRNCLEHAKDYARKAETKSNASLHDDFVLLGKHWLELTWSMQLLLDENVESPKLN
jgi:hypothetical protein